MILILMLLPTVVILTGMLLFGLMLHYIAYSATLLYMKLRGEL